MPEREPAIPDVTATPGALADLIDRVSSAAGPVAIDSERASGFRYGQRAYLVQLRREGAGTFLIDPIALPDLTGVSAAIGDAEWILHAASQDLPCLAEVGLVPRRLFDTELAGRLLGRERVGLAALVESELGVTLAKEHSAADWSTRPLPEPWLRYAALDVEYLIELREVLALALAEAGKQEWARQEFAALAAAGPPPPRVDPWRRTSGLHRVRTRRSMAVVQALWEARDNLARRLDVSPGRMLPDSAIVEASLAMPTTADALIVLPGFTGRGQRQRRDYWQGAISQALVLAEDALPVLVSVAGPPPARAWKDRDPAAAQRLAACREALAGIAEDVGTPVENLVQPEAIRRLCWDWTESGDPDRAVLDALEAAQARPWQVELCAPALAAALVSAGVLTTAPPVP